MRAPPIGPAPRHILYTQMMMGCEHDDGAPCDASPSGYFLKRAEPSKGLALFPTLTGRERIIYKSRTCPNLPRWTDILVGSCSRPSQSTATTYI